MMGYLRGLLLVSFCAFALAVPAATAGISTNLIEIEACVGGSCFGYELFQQGDERLTLVYDPDTQNYTWTLNVDVPILSLDGQMLMGTLQAGDTELNLADARGALANVVPPGTYPLYCAVYEPGPSSGTSEAPSSS